MIYKLMKSLIGKKYYEKEDMLNKMNVFLLYDQITQEQYAELSEMIQSQHKE